MEPFNFDSLQTQDKVVYLKFLANVEKRGYVNLTLSPCWISKQALASTGYGQIWVNGKGWNTHRYSYWIHNGKPELNSDKHCCHRCDHKDCCNPDHLYYDTPKQNAKDTWERGLKVKKEPKKKIRNSEPCLNCVEHHKKCDGKSPCSYCMETGQECKKKEYKLTAGAFTKEQTSGENNVKAKLTWEQVREIRARHAKGLKYGELKKIAEEYGIAYITVQKIVANKIWIE